MDHAQGITGGITSRVMAARTWIAHRTGVEPTPGSGIGQRVAALFSDRDRIAHFRGVPDGRGGTAIHQPPVTSDSGITAVRAYFTVELAVRHVETAERAIAALG